MRAVGDTTWSETAITAETAPAPGAVLDTESGTSSGTWESFDVSGAVSGDGLVSFAVTTTSTTALRILSRESANPPQLLVPAPAGPSPYQVTRTGSTYEARSLSNGTTFSGSLKSAVESAVADLMANGGGEVRFLAGTYDFGPDQLELDEIANITFAGAGMDLTVLQNNSSAATDTEPFDFVGTDHVVIRDMTISAGGPLRSTSDAIDFDQGNNSTVERVRIVASRARGIIFDGKGAGWTANGNTVRDCVITGVPADGIELLASSGNLITGCVITDVAGHGIQATKSSTSAAQPNKKSNDNQIVGNTIENSGRTASTSTAAIATGSRATPSATALTTWPTRTASASVPPTA